MSKTSELAHLFRALKAPAAARALPALAERAREEAWSYERFAEILLGTEVAARDSHGGEARIKAARFPAERPSTTSTSRFQRSVKKTVIEHLGQLDFLPPARTCSCSARPAPARPTSRSPLAIRACLAGQRVQFATATQWVARLAEAKRQGEPRRGAAPARLHPADRRRRGRLHPLRPRGRHPVLRPRRSRYERASMIVSCNKPFSAWAEIFGDDAVATAMVDRLVHHAEILVLKGDSYRLRGKDVDARPTPNRLENA